MESFLVAVNAIFPICLLIILGYTFKSLKIFNTTTLKEMNQFAFKILIPINLMENIINTNMSTAIDSKLIIFSIVMLLLIIIVAMLIVPKITIDAKKQGVIVQGLYRTNFVLLAIPICESLCGVENIGITSILVSIIVPIINVLAVFVLQYYGDTRASLKQTILSVLKNPMLIASIVGIIIQMIPISLPLFVTSTIAKISDVATPLALIVLGGTFEFSNVQHNLKEISVVLIGKLIIIPMIALALGIFVFHFRGISLASILVLSAGPVAVSSFPMAEAMGLDGKLAGEVVFTSTFMCLFTLFMWIIVVSRLGLL